MEAEERGSRRFERRIRESPTPARADPRDAGRRARRARGRCFAKRALVDVEPRLDPRHFADGALVDVQSRLDPRYFSYDARGLRTRVQNPRGYSTYFRHDLLGRQTHRIDALGGVSYMGYDQVGNQVLSLDELGNPTYFTHDGLNRSTHVKDALGGVSYLGYDSRSSAVLRVDADGRATYMAYDPARRLERQWFENPVEAKDQPIYFTYDQVGNLKIVDDRLQGLNVTYFDHDAMDRVGKKATITGWIYYEFDLSGKRTKLVDPDGQTNYYVHDTAGRLDKLQVAAGRSAYFAYDLSGMVTRRHAPLDEVVAYYTYDAAGRLKQLENRNLVGGLLSYFAYERNQIGAQTRIRHEGDEDTYYEYDALDRLTREFRLPTGTGREHDDAYVYDAVGNRTVKADQTAGENVYYTFDARNLMSKEWNKDAPETTYFDYDNARRMTSLKIEGGQSSYFTHDQREQVKKIEFAKASSPDQTQEFGYNGAGERVKLKIGDGSLTDLRLAFDGRKLLAEKNLAAIGFPTVRRYRHNTSLLDCMGSAIEWELNGSRLYGAFNGLGTLTNLLRDFGGGEIVDNTYVRDAFGKLVIASTPLGTNAGKLQFLTSGLLDLQLNNVQMNPLLLGGGCFLPRWGLPAGDVGGTEIDTPGQSSCRQRRALLLFLNWLRWNGGVVLCQDQGGDLTDDGDTGDPRDRTPQVPTCGPDATQALQAMLEGLILNYRAWTPNQRRAQCQVLAQAQATYDFNGEYRLMPLRSAWNIVEFGPGDEGKAAFQPMVPKGCAVPEWPCGDTVTVHGTCWNRQQVNYILLGAISNACWGSLERARLMHGAWQTFKLIKDPRWMRPGADPAYKQRLQEMYGIEGAWRDIGFGMPNIDPSKVAAAHTRFASRPESQCQTTCQGKVSQLSYLWNGFRGPGAVLPPHLAPANTQTPPIDGSSLGGLQQIPMDTR